MAVTAQTIRNLKAVVIACSVMSVIMPSPITYWNWWKNANERDKKIMFAWMLFSVIFIVSIYHYFAHMRGIEKA
jgi:hypothetical protein